MATAIDPFRTVDPEELTLPARRCASRQEYGECRDGQYVDGRQSTGHPFRTNPAAAPGASRRGIHLLLQRVAVQLAGADAHHPVQVPDEDLAVADLAGAGGLHHRLD